LKELRARHGLTQQRLAGDVGVTRQAIIAIERGNCSPSLLLALLMVRRLSVPLQQAFWLEDVDDPQGVAGQ
jgi:putative transcriptional regulator